MNNTNELKEFHRTGNITSSISIPEVFIRKERIDNIESTYTKVIQPEDEFLKDMRRPYKYAKDRSHEVSEDDKDAIWMELQAQQQMFADEQNFPFTNYK